MIYLREQKVILDHFCFSSWWCTNQNILLIGWWGCPEYSTEYNCREPTGAACWKALVMKQYRLSQHNTVHTCAYTRVYTSALTYAPTHEQIKNVGHAGLRLLVLPRSPTYTESGWNMLLHEASRECHQKYVVADCARRLHRKYTWKKSGQKRSGTITGNVNVCRT